MLKNYIKIAFRNLFKQKVYSSINIFGLAVGLACFILILLFVQHELSYDRFYENADSIYRVVQQQPGNNFLESDYYAVTPAPLATTLVDEFYEVTDATTIKDQSALLSLNNQHFWEKGLWADADFFDVFAFPLLRGNPKTVLDTPNSIVLTESLAQKIFGNQDPIGQTLLYQEQDLYSVTGLIADIPLNSSFTFTFITSIQSQDDYAQNLAENQWHNNWWYTFFVLANGTDDAQFQVKLQTLADTHLYAGGENEIDNNRTQYLTQPLTDIHLGRQFNNDMGSKGNITYMYLFLVIAFVILLLACVNYINLAVARSIRRGREVGMRKIVGAKRHQLIYQFLGESVLMALLAFGLALVMTDLLLPIFGHLVERPIQMDFSGNGLLLPGLLVLVVLVGLLSGSYPAFLMASLRPVQVLVGKGDRRAGHFRLQRLLIVGQYAVSIALVVGSFVVYQQMQYVQHKDVGYDREHVVSVRVNDEAVRENYSAIREEWLRDPQIIATTYSVHLPIEIESRAEISGWEGSSEDDRLTAYINNSGYDFLDVFGMELAAGRSFEREMTMDVTSASLINETAARSLGWTPEEAIGKHFMADGDEKIIIGVLKDFHMHSMHMRIMPLVIVFDPNFMGYISAKVRPENLSGTLALFEQTIKQFTPYPFEYQFLDDRFDQLYKRELRLGETFGFFTILALLIASLGLFGLAAYAAEQRTKEIGVRKVLGATVANIVTLLSKDFLKLVLIGFVIAIPIAWYAMTQWLQDFAYRIEIGPGVFLLAGLVAVLIALATVSWLSVRAAVANPVNSLRSE